MFPASLACLWKWAIVSGLGNLSCGEEAWGYYLFILQSLCPEKWDVKSKKTTFVFFLESESSVHKTCQKKEDTPISLRIAIELNNHFLLDQWEKGKHQPQFHSSHWSSPSTKEREQYIDKISKFKSKIRISMVRLNHIIFERTRVVIVVPYSSHIGLDISIIRSPKNQMIKEGKSTVDNQPR